MSLLYSTPIFKIHKEQEDKHEIIRLESPNWVNIIAKNKKNEILFIDQYRHGTKSNTLETPGGLIDEKDASPLEAAKRELQEETGYSSNQWKEIGNVYANPAYQDNQCFFFLALDIEKTSEPNPDEDEKINKVFFIPEEKVYKMLELGEITHSIILANLANYFIKKPTQKFS